MAFDFGKMANKVSDKVTKLGQEATATAKNVTENVKINSAISEQKKIIESMYMLIGRKYYEQNSKNPDEAFVSEVSNITAAMQTITELEKKLSEIKGTCPNCNAKITPGAAFCTSCGTKLTNVQTPPVQNQSLMNNMQETQAPIQNQPQMNNMQGNQAPVQNQPTVNNMSGVQENEQSAPGSDTEWKMTADEKDAPSKEQPDWNTPSF